MENIRGGRCVETSAHLFLAAVLLGQALRETSTVWLPRQLETVEGAGKLDTIPWCELSVYCFCISDTGPYHRILVFGFHSSDAQQWWEPRVFLNKYSIFYVPRRKQGTIQASTS